MVIKLLYAKTFNQRGLLKFFRVTTNLEQFDLLLKRLRTITPCQVLTPNSLNSFIGIEGQAARGYFSGLREILGVCYYKGVRSRRPPNDPFNSLLSYGYGILYSMIETE